MSRSAIWIGPLLLGLALRAPAQNEPEQREKQEAEKEDEKPEKSKGWLRFKNRPQIRLGKVLRLEFRTKMQLDFRDFDPAQKTHDEELFELHRARVAIEGRLFKDFEFELEHELGDVKNPWRDAYGNFRRFRHFQLQAGKFKIPFGLEEQTGPTHLDFALRSRVTRVITPARDWGVMLHGRFLDRGLRYQFGLFKNDGENAWDQNDVVTGMRTFAGRVTGTPLRLFRGAGPLKDIELGLAFTDSAVPEGLSGLRGKTFAKKQYFPNYNVRGHRLRLGTEFRWEPGPFSIKSEFMHARDQRLGQSLFGDDLPNLIYRGWYLSGTWVITGESKAAGVVPRKNFLTGRGIGAFEVGVRAEQTRIGSAQHPGLPSRGTRAANVLGSSDRAWTFGGNWYLNRWMKIQGAGMREKIEDLQRAPIPGVDTYWIRFLRIQLVM